MIDEISFKILRILQEKARIPNAEVARQVGMAPSAVLERIRKLEKMGVIEGYEVRMNPHRFGRSMIAFMTVTLSSGADPCCLGPQMAALPDVQEVHFHAGGDGFLLKVRVADHKALALFLQSHLHPLESVARIETRVVLETYKESARIPIDAANTVNDRVE